MRIEEAEELWGCRVSAVTDVLTAGYPGAEVVASGPAGENEVRFANIVSSKCHQAPRSGMGAVMGSKRLKTVVLAGGELPALKDAEALKRIAESFKARMEANLLVLSSAAVPSISAMACLHPHHPRAEPAGYGSHSYSDHRLGNQRL